MPLHLGEADAIFFPALRYRGKVGNILQQVSCLANRFAIRSQQQDLARGPPPRSRHKPIIPEARILLQQA